MAVDHKSFDVNESGERHQKLAVKPIHKAAMTRNQRSEIFNAYIENQNNKKMMNNVKNILLGENL